MLLATVCGAGASPKKTCKSLDITGQKPKIKASPPIRFRIEWACDQGKVTASWFQAHFYYWPLALAFSRSSFRAICLSDPAKGEGNLLLLFPITGAPNMRAVFARGGVEVTGSPDHARSPHSRQIP